MKNENISKAYLTFVLGDEKFAIGVENVQEIVEYGQVTKVPNAPHYMLGIINLRGRVLPLLDTRLKLGLPKKEFSTKTRIMVLDLQITSEKSIQIGAVVDMAKEVIEIHDSEIQVPSEFEHEKAETPIIGIVNNQGDITMIMDLGKVISINEINQFNNTTAA